MRWHWHCGTTARSTWKNRCCNLRATPTTVSEKVNNEELRKWLENLNDEDLGRYKM